MDRRLLHPKWLLATIGVVLLAVVFTLLGVWQLNRLNVRQADNAVGELQSSEPPTAIGPLLVESSGNYRQIEYRHAIATGGFDTDSEVLVRSQVYRGTAGFHVITPLVMEDGTAVLVNRGWVPLSMDTVPVAAVPVPVSGQVEGWVHLTQMRPSLGPEDSPDGRLVVMSRVDIERIQEQIDYELEPVYLVMTIPDGEELPVHLTAPDFSNEGPHLAYALQWFGFAVVLVVGYFFLVRSRLKGQTESGIRARS